MTPVPNSAPKSMWTRLDFFAGEFERLAKTDNQHALADNFRAFVHDMGNMPLTKQNLGPTLTVLEDYAIGFAQIARAPEQKALVGDFQHFVSEMSGHQHQEASPALPAAPEPDPRFYAYIDPVLTELEAFGDQFERLARNPEQRQLAAGFKDWVHHTSRALLIPSARTLAEKLFSETLPQPETPQQHRHQHKHKL